MVQVSCTPHNHIGNFQFDCANYLCQYGPNGKRSVLCKFCCFNDYFSKDILHQHCETCHEKFIESLNSDTDQDKKQNKKVNK